MPQGLCCLAYLQSSLNTQIQVASPSYALGNINAAIGGVYLSYHCIPRTALKYTSSAEMGGRGAACSVAKSRAGCCSLRVINYVTSDKKKTTEPSPGTPCAVYSWHSCSISQYTLIFGYTAYEIP